MPTHSDPAGLLSLLFAREKELPQGQYSAGRLLDQPFSVIDQRRFPVFLLATTAVVLIFVLIFVFCFFLADFATLSPPSALCKSEKSLSLNLIPLFLYISV